MDLIIQLGSEMQIKLNIRIKSCVSAFSAELMIFSYRAVILALI